MECIFQELAMRIDSARTKWNQAGNPQVANMTTNESNSDIIVASNNSMQMQIREFVAILTVDSKVTDGSDLPSTDAGI
jgi:hypothetical protein